ncbi:MAG: outer membrane protein assembly factor BamD [Deltaproteobacteria bacterium]|nr:outer membrane protein assembly factor BamD [Deltaproteobacteria bacterium]
MIKKILTLVLAGGLILSACAAPPQPKKKMRADEEYYQKAMNFFNKKNYFESIPAFEKIREKFPLSQYSLLAELRLGDSHFFKGEHIEAIHFFENFRRLHPSNQQVPYSIFMTGMCHYMQILTPNRDQTHAAEALEQFQLLLDLYPQSPYAGKSLCKISEAKQRIAEHEYFVARFYAKKKNYRGAIQRYTRILKEFPHAIDKDKIMLAVAEAKLAEGKTEKAHKVLQLLLSNYPESAYAAQARQLLK